MTELFRKYPKATPVEERKGSPVCVVSQPDAGGHCGRPAVGEVWGLPFCEVHGREAELAAYAELAATAENEISVLIDAEQQRLDTSYHVIEALRNAPIPGKATAVEDMKAYDAAARAAYPPEELAGNIDTDTLRFEYVGPGDTPFDWWSDAHFLICRSMRQAADRGV